MSKANEASPASETSGLERLVMRCLADMAQATAWINFTTAQANHDLQRFGEWRCDYHLQAAVFQGDFEKAARELMEATGEAK